MPPEHPQSPSSLRLEIGALYASDDRQSAQLRAAHLSSIVRLTPFAMACNLGSASLVIGAFSPAAPASLWVWWSAVVLVAILGLANWWKRRLKQPALASPRAVRRATLHAVALAGIWALVPLVWFPHATAYQQLTVATLLTGMLGAGTFMLHPLPRAAAAYSLIYLFACLGGLAQTGEARLLGVAALLSLYGPMVLIGSIAAWRKSNALLLSRAQSLRQERILAVLLDDFEQHAGEALWEIGADGRVTHASPRLWELLGIPAERARDIPSSNCLPASARTARRHWTARWRRAPSFAMSPWRSPATAPSGTSPSTASAPRTRKAICSAGVAWSPTSRSPSRANASCDAWPTATP
jgi:PAS domain-containing protein